MRRVEFTCDGCHFVTHIDLKLYTDAAILPDGWVAHQIVVHENGANAYEISADLCPDCTSKLRHAINPANWPKLDSSVRQFAKKAINQ